MLNRVFKDVTPSIKIISLLILIFIILVAKSIYLIIFISILTLIILINLGYGVKPYVQFIKNILCCLLFWTLIYIIIYRNIIGVILFSYKLVLITLLIRSFAFNLNFSTLDSGIYGILRPLKKFDTKKLSYNISIYLCFIKYLIYSKEDIKCMQSKKLINKYSIKYYLFPRILFCTNKIKEKDMNLVLNHYTTHLEPINFISILTLIISICMFISVLVKEVIL